MDSYSDLTKLHFPDNIRKRVGMYMGDPTDGTALHHMVFEVLDNCVDEFLEGHCKNIWIELMAPNYTTIKIRDDGRGIPVTFNSKENKNNLELALEDLHAGGKFDANAYKKSGGLHGVGLKAVNALSSSLEIQVYKGSTVYHIKYKKGLKTKSITEHENLTPEHSHGTTIRFCPDDTIFTNTTTFNKDIILARIKQTAYLNSGLSIHWQGVTYSYQNGLVEFINEIDKSPAITEVISIIDSNNNVDAKIALKWNNTSSEIFQCFTNNTYQRDGGTHLTSIRASLTKILLPYFQNESVEVISDDIREGLSYIISVYISDPRFSSQTKDKLVNSEIRKDLDELIQDNLKRFLDKNQLQLTKIKNKILLNAKAREAARKAKENVTKNSIGINISGKLADCSEKNEALKELIIVEGDSAGGSAKQARNRHFQAVLPLRGKILNTEKSSSEKVQLSKEINLLKYVIGSYPNFNYHKVIILTDADVDGSHIRVLLLTLFYRHMPELFEQGFVYIGKPPLFKVNHRKRDFYLLNQSALDKFILENGKPKEISRFKGLGEMGSKELWETTLNPLTRTLERVSITNILEAENTITMLMGSDVPPRKEFIINSSAWQDIKNIKTKI